MKKMEIREFTDYINQDTIADKYDVEIYEWNPKNITGTFYFSQKDSA